MFFEMPFAVAALVIHPAVETAAELMLAAALLLALFRLLRGPDTVDRVAALDLIAGTILSLALFRAIVQGDVNFMNIGLAIAVIVFIGTIAIARYLEKKALDGERAARAKPENAES